MSTRKEIDRRVGVVMAVIESRGWSAAVERAVARDLGVTPRHVRRYRAMAEANIRDAITPSDKAADGLLFIARLRSVQARMESAGAWGPLSATLSLEARVSGHDQTTIRLDGQPTAVILGAPVAAPAEED